MSRCRTWLTLLVAVSAWSALPAMAAPKPAGPDSVSLTFGWRPGMVAHVEHEATRTRSGAGVDSSSRSASSWRITVKRHPKGVAVHTDAFRLAGPAPPGDLRQFMERVMVRPPVQVISSEGEFVELEGIEAYRAELMGLMDSVFAKAPSAPANTREALKSMLSDGFIIAQAAGSWNAAAGAWVLGKLEVGTPISGTIPLPSPMVPGLEIPTEHRYEAVRRLPCRQGGPPDCIELTLTMRHDSVEVRKLVLGIAEKLTGDEGRQVLAALEGMRTESEYAIVTRPDGLLPQRLVQRKRITISGRFPGMEGQGSMVQEDVATTLFRWEK